ncbi:Hypothetical protein, putative, partial [Bodo saltans]
MKEQYTHTHKETKDTRQYRNTMSAKLANWEWKDDNDFWTPYYHADNTLIEAAFKSGQQLFSTKSLSFNAEHQSVYVYDFTKLTQKNQDSGRVRKLRRIESSATEDEEGFVAALGHTMSFHFGGHVGSAVAPPAPVIPVVAATALTSSSTDEPVSKKPRFEFPGLAVGAFPVFFLLQIFVKRSLVDTYVYPAHPFGVFDTKRPVLSKYLEGHGPISGQIRIVTKKKNTSATSSCCSRSIIPSYGPVRCSPVRSSFWRLWISCDGCCGGANSYTCSRTSHHAGFISSPSRRSTRYRRSNCTWCPIPSQSEVRPRPCSRRSSRKELLDQMLYREKQLCGDFGVFYHSYSLAALLYEVQAAVAAVLFRFKSEWATLPRLLKQPYNDLPDAASLLKLFPKMPTRDHDPRFRAVAISATSSLLAPDSEAPPKSVFLSGYSCSDLSFVGVLEGLLVSCGVPDSMKTALGKKIVELCSIHGLDASQFKGKPCKSGRAGHMLQIFVKRSLVDTYVYPAHPF